MKIAAKTYDVLKTKANILIIGIFEDSTELTPLQVQIDKQFKGLVSNYLLKKEEFSAKFAEISIFPTYKKNEISNILTIGLGKKKDFNLNKLRELAAKTSCTISKMQKNKVVFCELLGLSEKKFTALSCAKVITEGLLLGKYSFNKYKTKQNNKEVSNFDIIANSQEEQKEVVNAIRIATILATSQNFARDLVNEPAALATPSYMANVAQDLAEKYENLQCKIYDKKEIEELNFNALLTVSQGSIQEPKFIHLKYVSANPVKKIVLIGKGLTFDSGGLDLKTAAGMLTMKCDMAGCATVLGVMNAIAQIEPEIELHVLSALCENMPGGNAFKPGDVLKMRNGKTVEVDNTDAEGRLTLADVLSYADDIKADEVIDVATLTGACVVALGAEISGIMGKNNKIIDKFTKIGAECGETLWQLPILDSMQDALKSDVADMRNTGSRNAGASVAAQFLSNFVKNPNWTHIDIAGTAFIDKPCRELLSKGATGVLLRTLVNYVVSP